MGIDFDVVVVGAGPAGCAAAVTLARRGVNVVVVEKSQVPGQRNVTGGVIYAEYLEGYGFGDAFPGFENEAPLERRMVSHEVYLLSEAKRRNGEVDVKYAKISEGSLLSRLGVSGLSLATGPAYSVLRAKLDKWMAEKVREAGGDVATCTAVEDLIIEEGAVRGVVTKNEEVRARVVIDAGGVTSNLVERAGLRGRIGPEHLYHGVKHVYRLSPKKIEERFGVGEGEGKALFYIGPFARGVSGGAFIYTNRDTLSVGIVISLDSFIKEAAKHPDRIGKPLEMLEEFECHPAVSGLLEGAERLEYSAHNIPKGYKTILRKPYRAGFLAVGDALGAFVKIGALIDGMRRAVASGIMAAQTCIRALERGSSGEEAMAYYKELLRPIYRDVERSSLSSFLTEGRIGYGIAPRLMLSLARGTMRLNPHPCLSEAPRDAIQRIQERTGLLDYDEDKEHSHIKVDFERASSMPLKAWVAACPVNCYTLVLEKGVFASFRDLFNYNLSASMAEERDPEAARRRALRETYRDIARATLRFDHVACVACGTCGAIGPSGVVDFGHERDGHGVKFRYG